MSVLLERIEVPDEYCRAKEYCPTALNIYDDHVAVEGKRAGVYFYRDFTGISTQKASIFCAYACIIFLNPVSADQAWKNDLPVLEDRNRLLFLEGMLSYKRVNLYVEEVAAKLRAAWEAYKKGEHAADPIAQLKGYKELLDAGILTAEEFEEKKKQLLK